MHRRKMLKQIGAVSAIGLGATSFASAGDEGRLTHAKIENPQGELEVVSVAELRQLSYGPSVSDLSVGTMDCCSEVECNCLCEDC